MELTAIWEFIYNTIYNILAIGILIILVLRYFFGINLIDKWFERHNRKYQAELDRTTNELQEKLRVEYGSLYSKRVTAIEKIYLYIFALQVLLCKDSNIRYKAYEDPINNDWDYVSNIAKICRNLSKAIAANLIYFSKDDAASLAEVRNAVVAFSEAYNYFQASIDQENHFNPDKRPLCFWQDHKQDLIKLETDKVLDAMLDRFRELIGVNCVIK